MFYDPLQEFWDAYMSDVEQMIPTGMPHTAEVKDTAWPPVSHHTPPPANRVACYCHTCSMNRGKFIEWGLTHKEQMQWLRNGA